MYGPRGVNMPGGNNDMVRPAPNPQMGNGPGGPRPMPHMDNQQHGGDPSQGWGGNQGGGRPMQPYFMAHPYQPGQMMQGLNQAFGPQSQFGQAMGRGMDALGNSAIGPYLSQLQNSPYAAQLQNIPFLGALFGRQG